MSRAIYFALNSSLTSFSEESLSGKCNSCSASQIPRTRRFTMCKLRSCVIFSKMAAFFFFFFLLCGIDSRRLDFKLEENPLSAVRNYLICLPYLENVSSICNLRTLHVMSDHLNITLVSLSSFVNGNMFLWDYHDNWWSYYLCTVCSKKRSGEEWTLLLMGPICIYYL
jgi:hypothetical protein